MKKGCFIRKNSPELRAALKETGLHVCCCCEFEDWNWLESGEAGVHGICTVFDDEIGFNPSELFLEEDAENYTDCGIDEEMFLKLAKEIYEKTIN